MSETIKGRVVSVEAKNGGWMEAMVLLANGYKQKISTKDLRRWGDLKAGLSIKAECSVSETPSTRPGGKPFTNYYIDAWMEDRDLPPTVEEFSKANLLEGHSPSDTGGTADVDNPWPGKDRAIAMESAYHTAAVFFASRLAFIGMNEQAIPTEYPYTTDHLHTLAAEIYANVERARAGE